VYSEPIEILFRTALCCTRLDYPSKRVYILDDGGRREVRALAATLGCTYLHRPNRLGAKAGNLNYGLAHSSGELVACFDVDHVPVTSFLRETVGYFRDPNVALVQTPHTFINPDPFQRNLLLSRHIVNEQDLFYRIAMPGRDRWNAAFFCGSAAVLRRSALAEVGGFRTETVTEDIHTSVHLHARGYRSIYVDRPLSRGLAPESFAGYLSQRLRWARGAVQGLRLDNPLLLPGLTWRQRVLYFFAVYYFLFPLPRLIYTVAPLWFLLLGLKPLIADIPDLVNYFIPQFLLAVVVFDTFAEGHRSSFVSNAYELALSGWQLPVMVHAFFYPRRGQFTVTPKGETRMVARFRWVLALPSLILGSFLVCGILWGLVPLIFGQWLSTYTAVNLLWAVFHAITCAWAIAVAYERPQRREAHRVLVSLPAHLEAGGDAIAATIAELSETGSLVKTPQVPIPDVVELTLEVPLHGTMRVPARVVGREIAGPHQLKVRLAFD
ncbi:MAG: glycosyltransferase family 2 protein, partial [Candidatus Methylomirabilales bacterium]